jgi:hypothetical protein
LCGCALALGEVQCVPARKRVGRDRRRVGSTRPLTADKAWPTYAGNVTHLHRNSRCGTCGSSQSVRWRRRRRSTSSSTSCTRGALRRHKTCTASREHPCLLPHSSASAHSSARARLSACSGRIGWAAHSLCLRTKPAALRLCDMRMMDWCEHKQTNKQTHPRACDGSQRTT